jgi:hypothetical protein
MLQRSLLAALFVVLALYGCCHGCGHPADAPPAIAPLFQ